MDTDQCPSFVKLLLEDNFFIEIRIPPGFARRFREMLPERCKLTMRSTNMSYSTWKVSIIGRGEDDYFITEGDWPGFAYYEDLRQGDLLAFFLVKRETFLVLHYRSNCCIFNTRVKLADQYMILDSSSSSSSSSSESEEQQNSPSRPSAKKPRISAARGRRLSKSPVPKKSRFAAAKEADVSEELDSESVETGEDNIQCEFTFKKSHLIRMSLPADFVKKAAGLKRKRKIHLVNNEGVEWEVGLCDDGRRLDIGAGWSEFRNSNHISVGHTYVICYKKSDPNSILFERKLPAA